MMKKTTCTLITGASEGIGKAFANECASRGMNVALVALDDASLQKTAEEIQNNYPVNVYRFGIDLTDSGASFKVYQWTKEQNLVVEVLINNAGRGNSGLFESNPLDDYIQIMDLNNRSMVELTYYFLKDLKQSGDGHILNVSSMEATLPLPYKAVYTGSKSFIYAFTLALREELKGTGINATVLCPGSVLTNEEGYKRIQAHGNRGKLFSRLMITYPDIVAKRTIKSMLNGKQVVIPNAVPWFIVKFLKLMPTVWKMMILEKIFRVYKN